MLASIFVMGSLIDTATAIMTRSERQVEVYSQNISNATTPGYKRHLSFERILESNSYSGAGKYLSKDVIDFSPGKLVDTGRPYDLSIGGSGFFVVGASENLLYTRSGQFERDADGRLVNSQGQALQLDGGGDLILKNGDVKVLQDGTVLEGGAPVGKLAIVDIAPQSAQALDGGVYSAPENAVSVISKPSVHQGMLESSNTSNGQEMVGIMAALRRAETGQRLIGVYDDLMGRVLSTFGQS